MKIRHFEDIPETTVTMAGAERAKMRLLISEQDGADNFAMRMFTVEPGGHTPFHFHNYEHEVFVLAGSGVLKGADGEQPFRAGDAIFITANEKHQFVNSGEQPLQFLCLIPALDKCA